MQVDRGWLAPWRRQGRLPLASQKVSDSFSAGPGADFPTEVLAGVEVRHVSALPDLAKLSMPLASVEGKMGDTYRAVRQDAEEIKQEIGAFSKSQMQEITDYKSAEIKKIADEVADIRNRQLKELRKSINNLVQTNQDRALDAAINSHQAAGVTSAPSNNSSRNPPVQINPSLPTNPQANAASPTAEAQPHAAPSTTEGLFNPTLVPDQNLDWLNHSTSAVQTWGLLPGYCWLTDSQGYAVKDSNGADTAVNASGAIVPAVEAWDYGKMLVATGEEPSTYILPPPAT